MKYVSVKPLELLTREYNETIARYEFLIPCVRVMKGVLYEMKGNSFDIRNVQAICDAIKKEMKAEAYAYKGSDYAGKTYYSISVYLPTLGNSIKYEKFDTQYKKDELSQKDAFIEVLERFMGMEAWLMETRDKLSALESRHAQASELLEKVKAYSDLIE